MNWRFNVVKIIDIGNLIKYHGTKDKMKGGF